MEAVKAILMGCGALALLSAVGCVGLTGAGYYALDQAMEEQQAREAASRSAYKPDRASDTYSTDPFSDYEGNYDDDSDEEVGGWGDETR